MLRHLARRAAVALTFLLVAPALVGCGGEDKSDAPEAEPTSSRPLPKGWVRLTDEPTGVQFALPKKVSPELYRGPAAAGQVLIGRSYVFEKGDQALEVQVLTFDDGGMRSLNLDGFAAQIVASLTSAGATDARSRGPRKGKLFGVPSRDFTIEFTATTGDPVFWRVKALKSDEVAVLAQVIGDGETPASRNQAERALTAIARSIELSD